MRFRLAVLCAALPILSACATGSLRLERYRGAYSTHFEGIPDQAEACAVVRNAGPRALDWLELRLRARSPWGAGRALRSTWIYRGRVEPGEAVALRFVHAPAAAELEVRTARSGAGASGPRDGRPLALAKECSDEALRALLAAEVRGRTAPRIELRASERATPDAGGPWVAAP